ncbi:Mg2+ transporter protein CorA-like/Zinc transport protein ZntB [Neofusicoccum parvum]|nr:Mg2+ transporter protein CorA-like/Zinc transport protein ZntB [Neofusicoccum parvum]
MLYAKDAEAHVDWKADPYWRQRRISPAQLLVHDIRLEGWRHDAGPMLEIKEVLSSSLLPELNGRERLREDVDVAEWVGNRTEQYHFKSLISDTDPSRVIAAFRKMELCIYQNERFSKHGRYFSPFVQRLAPQFDLEDDKEDVNCPMLISVPRVEVPPTC